MVVIASGRQSSCHSSALEVAGLLAEDARGAHGDRWLAIAFAIVFCRSNTAEKL